MYFKEVKTGWFISSVVYLKETQSMGTKIKENLGSISKGSWVNIPWYILHSFEVLKVCVYLFHDSLLTNFPVKQTATALHYVR